MVCVCFYPSEGRETLAITLQDYTGEDVTVANIEAVLLGNASAVTGVCLLSILDWKGHRVSGLHVVCRRKWSSPSLNRKVVLHVCACIPQLLSLRYDSDNVLINFIDHGAPYLVQIPTGSTLAIADVHPLLHALYACATAQGLTGTPGRSRRSWLRCTREACSNSWCSIWRAVNRAQSFKT